MIWPLCFRLISRILIPLLLLVTLLISPSTKANQPHLHCEGSPAFCAAIDQAAQRLRDTRWTSWWTDWADEHGVVVKEHPELFPRQWWAKVWDAHPTIWATSTVTGDVVDSAILLHEIQHLIDGPECVDDPFSHERVIFWESVAVVQMGDWELFWELYPVQSRYYREARALGPEPCRARGVEEARPWGFWTYTELRTILAWWN